MLTSQSGLITVVTMRLILAAVAGENSAERQTSRQLPNTRHGPIDMRMYQTSIYTQAYTHTHTCRCTNTGFLYKDKQKQQSTAFQQHNVSVQHLLQVQHLFLKQPTSSGPRSCKVSLLVQIVIYWDKLKCLGITRHLPLTCSDNPMVRKHPENSDSEDQVM